METFKIILILSLCLITIVNIVAMFYFAIHKEDKNEATYYGVVAILSYVIVTNLMQG